MTQANEAIRDELKDVRSQIKGLKKEFLERKEAKETHFTEGEKVSKEIDTIYEEVREIEKEHNLDKINEELEARKKDQEELSKKLEDLETQFTEVKKKVRKPRPKKTIPTEKIEKDIAKLDLELQTQVLSLDKESAIIAKITSLKEQLGAGSGKGPVIDDPEYRSIKRELNSTRRKFNNTERKIRSLYKQIRLVSKEKKKKYKTIDELRDDKKNSFDQFRSHKQQYAEIGKTLKDLFKKEEELMKELGETPRKKGKKGMSDAKFKEKQKDIEDKLTKGEVLTTEDLLMLQARN